MRSGAQSMTMRSGRVRDAVVRVGAQRRPACGERQARRGVGGRPVTVTSGVVARAAGRRRRASAHQCVAERGRRVARTAAIARWYGVVIGRPTEKTPVKGVTNWPRRDRVTDHASRPAAAAELRVSGDHAPCCPRRSRAAWRGVCHVRCPYDHTCRHTPSSSALQRRSHYAKFRARVTVKASASPRAPTERTRTRGSSKTVREAKPPSRPSGAMSRAPSEAESRARAVTGPTSASQDERAVVGGDRAEAEVDGQGGGEVVGGERGGAVERVAALLQRDVPDLQRAEIEHVHRGVERPVRVRRRELVGDVPAPDPRPRHPHTHRIRLLEEQFQRRERPDLDGGPPCPSRATRPGARSRRRREAPPGRATRSAATKTARPSFTPGMLRRPPRRTPAAAGGRAAWAATSSSRRAAPSPPARGRAGRAWRRPRSRPRCRRRAP